MSVNADVQELRERAQRFDAVVTRLRSMGPALRADKAAHAEWQQLMLDGNAIRAAIQTAAKMLDGANKWVSRTFRKQALDSIPFAADVVRATATGSINAIDGYLDRAEKAARKFVPLVQDFEKLNDKEKQRLSESPSVADASAKKQSAAPALILIAILGGVVLFGDKLFQEQEPEYIDHE